MGQLHMTDLPDENICPECKRLAPEGKVSILGSRGITRVDVQMWSRSFEDRIFHATLHIGNVSVVLCRLPDHLRGQDPVGPRRL